ncbi:MAG: hypothetical protein HXS54_18760 [Theionarchaea archaeon]|nr:hypothetical protein [Theionarchaea archaeon]
MNEKKLRKSYAFKLLTATVLIGLCSTLVSEPISAKGRFWGIEITIHTESGVLEQDDQILLNFIINDLDGVHREIWMIAINAYKGETKRDIRDRIVKSLNDLRSLNRAKVFKSEPDQTPNLLWVEIDDNYKGSRYLSIDNIKYQTEAKNQNDAFQIRLHIFDP